MDQFVFEKKNHIGVHYNNVLNVCVTFLGDENPRKRLATFQQAFAGLAIHFVACSGKCNSLVSYRVNRIMQLVSSARCLLFTRII